MSGAGPTTTTTAPAVAGATSSASTGGASSTGKTHLTHLDLTPDRMVEFNQLLQKPVVFQSEMTNEVQTEAIDLIISALDAIKKSGTYDQAAKTIKDAMDRKFGPVWHAIVGESFDYSCTFQEKTQLVVFYGTVAVLLFKC